MPRSRWEAAPPHPVALKAPHASGIDAAQRHRLYIANLQDRMTHEKAMAENAAIGASSRSSLPIGNQPGAPGKNPEYKRFTHHDVDMMKRDRT